MQHCGDVTAGPTRPPSCGVLLVTAGLALLTVAAGCTDREVTRPEPEPVTLEGLRAAALGPDDLPGDPTASASGISVGSELLDTLECDDLLTGLVPNQEASTQLDTGQVVITSTVAHLPGAGRATTDHYNEVRERCSTTVDTAAGVSVRASRLSFGALTDRTLPIKLELEAATGPITEIAVILVREGDLVHVIRATGDRPIDRELLDSAARAAIGKLSALALDTGE
jgi:hypothetical protein